MNYRDLRKGVSLVIALVFILSFSSFSFANELDGADYIIYNITKGIGYTAPLSDADIIEINDSSMAGDEFAKRIAGKLVNFNDYYDKLVEVYEENMDLPEGEIIEKIIEAIPGIIEELPEVEVEPGGEDPDPVDEPQLTLKEFKRIFEFDAGEELKNFGYVTVNVKNIGSAAKFGVQYTLNDGNSGETDTLVALGTETKEPIFYEEGSLVTIHIYDAAGEWLHTFENVTLDMVD